MKNNLSANNPLISSSYIILKTFLKPMGVCSADFSIHDDGLVGEARSQNRDHTESRLGQKTVIAAMIRHQNALAMFLASALMRRIHPPPPLKFSHFEYFQGSECLSLALQQLRQNHRRQNQEVDLL